MIKGILFIAMTIFILPIFSFAADKADLINKGGALRVLNGEVHPSADVAPETSSGALKGAEKSHDSVEGPNKNEGKMRNKVDASDTDKTPSKNGNKSNEEDSSGWGEVGFSCN